ncbi:kalirin-like [Atheta coriaria]|uniref:kalirin-like n=1 Tax=Dalotia coriaria TaxID=877792 RepID=UPI0031F46DF6
MDVEEIRQLARDAENAFLKAMHLNKSKEDDEDSISSVLDELEKLEYLETHFDCFEDNSEESETPEVNNNNVPSKEEENQRIQIEEYTNETSSRGSILEYTVEEPDTTDESEQSSPSLRGSILEYIVDSSDTTDESEHSGRSLRGSMLEYIVEEQEHNERSDMETSKVPRLSIQEIVAEANSQGKSSTENNQLNFIVEELISTEIEYLRSLYFLQRNFLKPIRCFLKMQGDDYKTAEKMYNYAKILNRLGSHFLDDLVQVPVHQMGDVFLKHKTLFNMYSKMSGIWNIYMKSIRDPSPAEYVKKLELDLNEAMGFSRYMLKPMQRLAKYELLLNQILKHMSNEDEISGIEEAVQFMKDVLLRCNTIVALESIEYQKYTVEETGNYIMKFDLNWRVKRRKKKLVLPTELFLFEKVVIIAVSVEGCLQYRDSMSLSTLTRVDMPDTLKFTLEELGSTAKQPHIIKFEAANAQIKQKCIDSIDELLWAQLLSLKQQQLALLQEN